MGQGTIHGGDIYRNDVKLDFSVNINPFGVPEGVRRAMEEAVGRCACYPDIQSEELVSEISLVTGISPGQLVCGNGASELFLALLRALKPGKALIPVPSFYGYERAARAAGCQVIFHEMKEDAGFGLDAPGMGELVRALREGARVLFLANPNNPSGSVTEPGLLLELAGECLEKDVTLVLDECFAAFTGEQDKHSFLGKLARFPNVAVVRAFTKVFAVPGVRLGYLACGSAKLAAQVREQLPEWNLSVFAQAAGAAACRETEYVRESVDYVCREREWLRRELEGLGLFVYPSRSCFLLVKTGLPLYDILLGQGILIRDCRDFRGLGPGFYRIAVKKRKENELLLCAIGEAAREAGLGGTVAVNKRKGNEMLCAIREATREAGPGGTDLCAAGRAGKEAGVPVIGCDKRELGSCAAEGTREEACALGAERRMGDPKPAKEGGSGKNVVELGIGSDRGEQGLCAAEETNEEAGASGTDGEAGGPNVGSDRRRPDLHTSEGASGETGGPEMLKTEETDGKAHGPSIGRDMVEPGVPEGTNGNEYGSGGDKKKEGEASYAARARTAHPSRRWKRFEGEASYAARARTAGEPRAPGLPPQFEYVLPGEIERRSFEIIEEELQRRGISLCPDHAPVVKRVIHTSADFSYAGTMAFSDGAVAVAQGLLRRGADIVTDTNMALAGINTGRLARNGGRAYCFMADPKTAQLAKEKGMTRAAASMERAAALIRQTGRPTVFAIGNAPTALARLYEMICEGSFVPDFLIGVPVGFVNVEAAKELILKTDVPYIVNRGRKGGSNVAAAICNALLYGMEGT